MVSRGLAVLAALALATGALLTYAEHTMFRSDAFADRAASSLQSAPLRAAAARRITAGVVAIRPNLTALQPVIELAARGVVGTEAFRSIVRRTALEAHRSAFDQHRRTLTIQIRDAGLLVADGVRRVRPGAAVSVPAGVVTRVGRVKGGIDGFMLRLSELADTARGLRTWAFVAALVLAAAALAVTDSRRASVLRLGTALAAVGATVATASALAPGFVAGSVGPGDRRAVRDVLAVWLDPITAWSVAGCVAGLVVVLAAASVVGRVPVTRLLRQARTLVLAPPRNRLERVARTVAAIALGAAMVASPREVLTVAVVAVGALLVLAAFAEALAAVAGPPSPTRRAAGHARRGLRVAGAALAITAGVAGAAALSSGDASPLPRVGRCNGHVSLCDRRVDQVAFLATHNAMAAAGEPGWLFAAQDAGIPQQLDDGVRALMIDTHYGATSARGVITEFEGTAPTRAKFVEELGERFVATAERLRARMVRGRLTSKRQVFLCHGFCEVGATRAVEALRALHRFLVRHPEEVVVLLVQDETNAVDTAAAIRASGLVGEVYRGDARPPWPTLGELVERDERVIVMAENHAGQEPWIHHQPAVAQETPFSFPTARALEAPAACEPHRGGTAGSLLLVNHWVDTTPAPRVTIARRVNAEGFLSRRLRTCRERRGMLPNLVAVDFYRQGDAARVVDGLNRVR
jgi:hypothetical protein